MYQAQLSHWKDQEIHVYSLHTSHDVAQRAPWCQHSVIYIPYAIKDVDEIAGRELSYQKMMNPVYLYIIKDVGKSPTT